MLWPVIAMCSKYFIVTDNLLTPLPLVSKVSSVSRRCKSIKSVTTTVPGITCCGILSYTYFRYWLPLINDGRKMLLSTMYTQKTVISTNNRFVDIPEKRKYKTLCRCVGSCKIDPFIVYKVRFDGEDGIFVQHGCSISTINALEILESCNTPSLYTSSVL